MNHLIIFAHPNNQDSFNQAVLNRLVQTSEQLGMRTVVRDLYKEQFNPVLGLEEMRAVYQGVIPAEIRFEQQQIDNADLITLVYPLWWMGAPAILKGYFDRVLGFGFAYKTENGQSVGLLGSKKMQQFVTVGSAGEKYRTLGFDKSLNDCLGNGLFNFCGIENVEQSLFTDVYAVGDSGRQTMLEQVEQQTQRIFTALSQMTESEDDTIN